MRRYNSVWVVLLLVHRIFQRSIYHRPGRSVTESLGAKVIDRSVPRDPNQPCTDRSKFLVIGWRTVPDPEKCFLQEILSLSSLAHYMDEEPKAQPCITIVELS